VVVNTVVSLQIFFLHFISRIFYHQSIAPIAASEWLVKYLRVNYSDFLMPTDAVTQKYLVIEKYYYPNRLGWRQKVLQPLIT
jgi:hypothetical protein